MARIYDKFPILNGKDPDERSRRYLTPTRIVWSTLDEGAEITGMENLLTPKREQITLNRNQSDRCVMANKPGKPKASILLDFGMEINGALRLMVWGSQSSEDAGTSDNPGRANVRVRLGESVMEAMTDLGVKNTTNDHANRDFVMNLGSHSAMETNESGFRFARIDLLGEESAVSFKSINAVFIFRDIEYKGSFDCSDPLLNKIWNTAAYTAHLNMQEYLWDGIKRDRLVWVGDTHPEMMTIRTLLGHNNMLDDSLRFARRHAPIPNFMNGMPSYSLWWLLIMHDYYMATGDKKFLNENKKYVLALADHMASFVKENGEHALPDYFLDWPTRGTEAAKPGVHGLFILTMRACAEMADWYKAPEAAARYTALADAMAQHCPDCAGYKQAVAMQTLAGLRDAAATAKELTADGAKGMSTFMSYYILKAMSEDNMPAALNVLREYYGGMLDMGATTFWEDFHVEWLDNAARIDEVVPEGKVDLHGDFGAFCYVGLRHSFCHGWSGGVTAFIIEHMLGLELLDGYKRIRVTPHALGVQHLRADLPTPYGTLTIDVTDGKAKVIAPEGIAVEA